MVPPWAVTIRKGSNRRLEFELGTGFEGACGFALVLALSQMRTGPRSPKSKVQSPKSGSVGQPALDWNSSWAHGSRALPAAIASVINGWQRCQKSDKNQDAKRGHTW
jgi:hypothetical protein